MSMGHGADCRARAPALPLVLSVLGLAPGAIVAQDYTVAYASFGPLNTDIFITDGDGTDAVPFLPDPGLDYNASFSADEQWVIFTSERNGSADIYRARPDGSDLERLTDDVAFDDQAALSPDGRTLAFVSSRSGNADVWLLDLQTRGLRNLTDHAAGEFRPAWSPNGEWIAFSTDRDSPNPKLNFALVQSTEIYVVRRDGTGLRRLTNEQGVAGSPAWSPDGANIAFYQAPISEAGPLVRLRSGCDERSGACGTTQVAVLELATGNTRVLTDGPGAKLSPQWMNDTVIGYVDLDGLRFTDGTRGPVGDFQHADWSRDARQVIFHRDLGGELPTFRPVYSRDPQFNLIRTGLFPHYAPDGMRMTINSAAAGIEHNSILIMNPDGSQRSLLFDDPERSALAPVWSPRGDRIAFGLGGFFTMVRAFTPAAIAVIDVQSRELTVLTDDTQNAGFPGWSPDGERIVYRTQDGGASALVIMDVRTREITPLLSDFGSVNFPSWSPRGDLVQFTSNKDGDGFFEIYTIDVGSRRITRLTDSFANDAHAAWSPDGEWLAFSSGRQGFRDEGPLHPGNPQGSEIYVMRYDGSDVRILTDNPFEEATPGWAPLTRRR